MRSWLHKSPALALVLLLIVLLPVWAGRLAYPYDLEWMEGGMLAHAWRLQQGLPLYTPPSPGWIPFIYPPGYATTLAAAGSVFGLEPWVGRALSLAGSLAAALAAAFLVRRQGGDGWAAAGAAGLFLAVYVPTGAFFDLVRIDGLGAGLLAWSLALALEPGAKARRGSALLLAIAFLFKQNVALFGLPVAWALSRRDGWRGALDFALWSAVPALAVTVGLQVHSEGLYLRYLLGVPASHPLIGDRIFPGTPRELGGAIGLGALVGAGWLVSRSPSWAGAIGPNRQRSVLVGLAAVAAIVELAWPEMRGLPYIPPGAGLAGIVSLALGLGVIGLAAAGGGRALAWRVHFGLGVAFMAVLSSAMMRGHHGGFVNVHIPLFWVVSVGAGVALSRLRGGARELAAVLVTAQIVAGAARVQPGHLVPGEADVEVGDALVTELGQVEGPVLSPFAPWLAHQAGHEPGFHLIALWDVRHESGPFPGVADFIAEAAKGGYWGAIVDGPRGLGFDTKRAYRDVYRVQAPPRVFQPRTGWPARPVVVKGRRPPKAR